MKLVFAQMDLNPKFKKILKMVFGIADKELGLTENPVKVLFTLLPVPGIKLTEEGGVIPEGVRVSSDGVITSNGQTEHAVDADGFIRLQIAPQRDLRTMMETFCHELVHVCQDISGSLVGDEAAYHVTWRGQDYTSAMNRAGRDFKAYEELPWEKQAREMAAKIMPLVDAEAAKIAAVELKKLYSKVA